MNLRFVSFHVENFRSVIDSKWCDLSIDNITGIIGQNESGKTSVLESLYSFYTGKLTPDSTRSDGTMPKITCSFHIEDGFLNELESGQNLDPDIIKFLKTTHRVNLTRQWEDDTKDGKIELEESELREIFDRPAVVEEITPTPAPAEDQLSSTTSSEEPNPTPATTPVPPIVAKPIPMMSSDEFVAKLYENIPVFEFFEDFGSLLPDQIDHEDLVNQNQEAQGYKGASNYIDISEIDLKTLVDGNQRKVANQIRRFNKNITDDFRNFWSQRIGGVDKIEIELELKNYPNTEKGKSGKPYLVFWMSDPGEKLHPKQRSKGVRWFLSFYLNLRASARRAEGRGRVFLIDEPGADLHAKAQEDVLKLFETLKKDITILYTTHSPYLIGEENFGRLLAAQRKPGGTGSSTDTEIISSHDLSSASSDTLTPLYTIMGVRLSSQNLISAKKNVILEEPSAFYYFHSFLKLLELSPEIHLLPATGVTNIPLLANLFLGWGLEFGVVMDDDPKGRSIYNSLAKGIFGGDDSKASSKIYLIDHCLGIEDVFSIRDFTKLILKDESTKLDGKANSVYLKDNRMSKALLAYDFKTRVDDKSVTIADFSKTTIQKIERVIQHLLSVAN